MQQLINYNHFFFFDTSIELNYYLSWHHYVEPCQFALVSFFISPCTNRRIQDSSTTITWIWQPIDDLSLPWDNSTFCATHFAQSSTNLHWKVFSSRFRASSLDNWFSWFDYVYQEAKNFKAKGIIFFLAILVFPIPRSSFFDKILDLDALGVKEKMETSALLESPGQICRVSNTWKSAQ